VTGETWPTEHVLVPRVRGAGREAGIRTRSAPNRCGRIARKCPRFPNLTTNALD
jgi:hypothetical protein